MSEVPKNESRKQSQCENKLKRTMINLKKLEKFKKRIINITSYSKYL